MILNNEINSGQESSSLYLKIIIFMFKLTYLKVAKINDVIG